MGSIINEYPYCLRGKYGTLAYAVDSDVNNYFKRLQRTMQYKIWEEPPRDVDFLLRCVNNEVQKPHLGLLVDKIKSITQNRDDQVRIAVSLVQHIPYDHDGVANDSLTDKYPYEVLYTRIGVCEEKSRLLGCLLRGLGYGAVLFRFPDVKHAVAGIKCPREYSYLATGFCFVESNRPEIITNSQNEYVGAGKIVTKPRTLLISNGDSFNSVVEEYNDAIEYNKIVNNNKVDDRITLNMHDYNKLNTINKKYGIQMPMEGEPHGITNYPRVNNQNSTPQMPQMPQGITIQPGASNPQDKVLQVNMSEVARNAADGINNIVGFASKYIRDIKMKKL